MTRRGVRSQSGLMPSPAMYAQQVSAIFAFAVSGSPSFRNTSRSFCAFVRRYAEPSHRMISHVAQRSTTSIWVHPYNHASSFVRVRHRATPLALCFRHLRAAIVAVSTRACTRGVELIRSWWWRCHFCVRPRIRWCGAIVFSSRR